MAEIWGMDSREGKAKELLDALAVVRRWSYRMRAYRTTLEDCRCPDRLIRGGDCKHMLALRALKRERVLDA